jgi:ATP-dependent Clp protease adapter protein ClpS
VVQRAAVHLRSSGRDQVTGANVLVALFSERESHAVFFLQSQDMTRLDAVNFISHGIAKAPGRRRERPGQEQQRGRPGKERDGGAPAGPTQGVDRAGTYNVLLLNDDSMPLGVVADVLTQVFQKSREEALVLMLEIQRKAVGVCGPFPYEVAAAKVAEATELARQNGHQLQCRIEKA